MEVGREKKEGDEKGVCAWVLAGVKEERKKVEAAIVERIRLVKRERVIRL